MSHSVVCNRTDRIAVFAQLRAVANWSLAAVCVADSAQRSRGRNLGQTVDNIQEKTER